MYLGRTAGPGLDLDSHLRMRKTCDIHDGLCGAVSSQPLRNGLPAGGGVPFADEVDRQLDDIAEIHLGRLEVEFEIVEHDAELLERVVRHVSIRCNADLSGNHDHPFAIADLDLV